MHWTVGCCMKNVDVSVGGGSKSWAPYDSSGAVRLEI